ncbi:MAG: hypothetical protein IPK85_05535 [Gemmatimonadetes bacterium]|nr:hypothetical protein [Gemmatimonadota bacterium]
MRRAPAYNLTAERARVDRNYQGLKGGDAIADLIGVELLRAYAWEPSIGADQNR